MDRDYRLKVCILIKVEFSVTTGSKQCLLYAPTKSSIGDIVLDCGLRAHDQSTFIGRLTEPSVLNITLYPAFSMNVNPVLFSVISS